MNKTILINIQIDGVTSRELGIIEDLLEEALGDYTRKQINYNITDQLGTGLPVREVPNNT